MEKEEAKKLLKESIQNKDLNLYSDLCFTNPISLQHSILS